MTDDVLFEIRGRAGLITLNRPQALNALNHAMCVSIYAQMKAWIDEPLVERVVIRGAGDRAFCAGGDIIGLHNAGKSDSPGWEGFFFDEYRLNHLTSVYPKPYVALIDGITMGGGVGLSVHGPYRVATEKTLFAMPETGIGLIPDVGGTHLLGHMPGELGVYLGLTGDRLKTADCLFAGIATHVVGSGDIEALVTALADDAGSVDDILARFAADAGEAPLKARLADIDRYFAGATVEAILGELSMGDDWAVACRDKLLGFSPISMKLTLKAVRAARGLDLAACLAQEYRIVGHIKHGHDFFEGVRALLIDKDKSPKWKPAALADISAETVDGHFAPLPGGELTFEF